MTFFMKKICFVFVIASAIFLLSGCSNVIDEPSEWGLVREYVTSNYPISDEYFVSAFEFVKVRRNKSIRDYDPSHNTHFNVSGFTDVVYDFAVFDEDGKEIVIKNLSITIYNDQVVDSANIPAEEGSYLYGQLWPHRYENFNPIAVPLLEVSHKEALDLMADTTGCVLGADADITLSLGYNNVPYWNFKPHLLSEESCQTHGITGETIYSQFIGD